MTFRKAHADDLYVLTAIIDQAIANFKADGIDQWQNGYPNPEILLKDISEDTLYVLEIQNQIIGLLNLVEGPDASYAKIDGKWMNDLPYTAFHTVCIQSELRGNGYSGILFKEAEALSKRMGYQTVRIDTHHDNKAMQHALSKAGYQVCGTIHLVGDSEHGAPRIGYQKML